MIATGIKSIQASEKAAYPEAAQNNPAIAHVLVPEAQPAVDLLQAQLNLVRAMQQCGDIGAILAQVPALQGFQRIHLPLKPKSPCSTRNTLYA